MANPTVADLVAALLKLPQDVEVECKKEVDCGYATTTEFAPVDIKFGLELLDFTKPGDEKFGLFGRKFVQITAE